MGPSDVEGKPPPLLAPARGFEPLGYSPHPPAEWALLGETWPCADTASVAICADSHASRLAQTFLMLTAVHPFRLKNLISIKLKAVACLL